MDLAELERRITHIEDIEAIKQLKARYCALCDAGYDADGIAPLFTEDGLWDGGRTFGRREGRAAIHAHFAAASRRISIARHQVMDQSVRRGIDKVTARAKRQS